MIRILHVLGSLDRGGTESMLMNIYREIDKSQIQFDFIIHTDKKCDFDEEIEKLGGKIYCFPRYNLINHFKYIKYWKEFLKKHKEYNIIHGHLRGSAFLYLKIAKNYKLTTIMHAHSTSSRGSILERKVKNILRYFSRRYIDYFWACSIEAGKWLFGNSIVDSKNFKIIKNGIDIEKYTYNKEKRDDLRKKLALDNKFVIGHVGSFTYPKNHKFILDIFNKIQKENENSILLLIGDGELKNKIIKKIKKLGLEEKVILTGNIVNVNDYMSIMDVFLFPSLNEGLGMVIIEAQVNGLKCFVSENLPKEIELHNNLINRISLKQSSKEWAKIIMDNKRYERNKKIRNESYSIKRSSIEIQKIYYQLYYCNKF